MTDKTGAELMARSEYVRTRGTAAAHEAGCRTPAEIAAFHAGAEWMAGEIERTHILTPRPLFVQTKDGLIPLGERPGMRTEDDPCKRIKGHCFHSTGEVLTSHPPQYPQVCCFCEARRTLRGMMPYKEPGHGPFEPPR